MQTLPDDIQENENSFQVFVRIKPMSQGSQYSDSIIEKISQNHILIKEADGKPHERKAKVFSFNGVFDIETNNKCIFDNSIKVSQS